MIKLILGGARSGKSRFAEQLAKKYAEKGKRIIYIATATGEDSEMQERIAKHRRQRPSEWQTIECPIILGDTIRQFNEAKTVLLIDCLTLWVSNLLCDSDQGIFEQQRLKFIETIKGCRSHIIMVSNETGLGVIPMGQLTRRFVDESGFLHQEVAGIADEVTFMVAGLAHKLK